jgi:hypothetical protein
MIEVSSKSSDMLLQIPNFTLFNECTKAMNKDNTFFSHLECKEPFHLQGNQLKAC